MPSPTKIGARQITEPDIPAVIDLLARGFPDHSAEFWRNAFKTLTNHRSPEGFPRYGYLVDADGTVMGAILLIFSERPLADATIVQCNLSSWYIEPSLRTYGTLLASKALSHPDVTYLNITPAIPTLPILRVQGYSRYSNGIFLALPALQLRSSSVRIIRARPGFLPASPFEQFEHELLCEHTSCGCLGLWCVTPQRAYPFVFRARVHRGLLPYAQLIYCPSVDTFVRFAGPIGRFLIARGWSLVMIDANGPIPGLVGFYRDGKQPKYFKGPHQPRLGDLAYTEAAMFGL